MPKGVSSLLWDYFEKNKVDQTAKCLKCSVKLSLKGGDSVFEWCDTDYVIRAWCFWFWIYVALMKLKGFEFIEHFYCSYKKISDPDPKLDPIFLFRVRVRVWRIGSKNIGSGSEISGPGPKIYRVLSGPRTRYIPNIYSPSPHHGYKGLK